MTTEATGTARPSDRSRRLAAAAGCALAAWIALAALITVLVEPGDRVIVIAPASVIDAVLADRSLSLIEIGPGGAVLGSDKPGYVRRLYAGGAWLVLPRRIGGCTGRVSR